MTRLEQIKKLVIKDCRQSKVLKIRFKEIHLDAVDKYAKFLLKKLPKADKNIVMLGVWLHDIQRIRGLNGDHEKIGAIEAGKIMKKYKYEPEIIKKAQSIISTHSCKENMPNSLEGKILASADSMSHYDNDFFLTIACTGQRNAKEFKEWAREKLSRDYKVKIFFDFARKKIEDKHRIIKNFINLK